MKLLTAMLAGISLLAVTAAKADSIILDPLHGLCSGPACTSTNVGGTPVVPITNGNLSGFGFASSPPHTTGELTLDLLIPDNFTLAEVNAYIAALGSVGGAASPATGTVALFNTSPWINGDMTTYLGISASPPNPLSAWLPATKTIDPTATGYYVVQADMGSFTLGGPGDALTDIFSVPGFADGGMIAATVCDKVSSAGACLDIVTTAQSEALFYNGVNASQFAAVPAPIVGAGIPGLIAGCFALLGLRQRRQKRFLGLA